MSGSRAANPFSPRVVLGMLLFGALAFLLTLYFVGAGEMGNDSNSSGHGASRGLNGYAALVSLLEKSGYQTSLLRNEGGLASRGLLVLTPPHSADGKELQQIVSRRRYTGPTIVVLPKWYAAPAPKTIGDAKKGWVMLFGSGSPVWRGFADDVSVSTGNNNGWRGGALSGTLPDETQVQSVAGNSQLISLVLTGDGKRILAAYRADRGCYPALERMTASVVSNRCDDEHLYPLVFVFEPDLLDNYGMAEKANALLAGKLIAAVAEGTDGTVIFDLTQNGLGRAMNLLTLAFKPPFFAATLCLLIAAIVIGWRAFHRFGPPLAEAPAMPFGKRQLVKNGASLIRRTRRLHLLGPPYAALMRRRIAAAMGLQWGHDTSATDDGIDRALSARGASGTPFFALAEKLAHARSEHELLRAANALKQIERMLGQ